MLSKKNRATGYDIKQTLAGRHGTKHSTFFSIRYSIESIEKPLCSVVVSKRVARTAAERNALKRKLRSAIQGVYQQLPNKTLIVYAKAAARDLTVREMSEELSRLLRGV